MATQEVQYTQHARRPVNVNELTTDLRERKVDAARFVIDVDRGSVTLLADAQPPPKQSERAFARQRAALVASEHLLEAAQWMTLARATASPQLDWIVGGFLRELVTALEPALRLALRSRLIVLPTANAATIALRSDGLFVNVDAAQQEDVMDPVQVARLYPDLRVVLDAIRRELRMTAPTAATTEAEFVLGQAQGALDAGDAAPLS